MDQPDHDEQILPIVQEELVAEKREVKTGSVRVDKHVERRIRRIDLPLVKETVEVKRVPINQVVETPPAVRRSGEVIIIPVVEEEVIVTRRLILKEEVHVLRHRTRERTVKEIPVERERAVVRHLDEKGRVIDNPRPKRRGLLE